MKTILSAHLNRIGYAAFVIAGILFCFFKQDYSGSAMYLGLALIFDPFDTKVTFQLRPMWQKTWLMMHLIATGAMFILMALQ